MNVSTRFTRRRIVTAGIGTAALVITSGPLVLRNALAQDAAVRYVNSDGVRLRSGAGLSFSVVTTLSNGTRVNVLEAAGSADGYQWARVTVPVQSDELDGYVASEFLGQGDEEPEDPTFPVGSTFVVDTAGGQAANVRSAPGTGSSIVTFVANGTEGEILSGPTDASGYRWFNVAIAGVTGYIADLVISPGSGGSEPPGFEPWPVGSRVVVADGPLNLRDEPYGAILETYSVGSLATVSGDALPPATGDGIVWYPVDTDDGRSGWFAAEYLALTDDDGGGSGDSVRVVDGPLNLRSQPSTSGSVILTATTDTQAAVNDVAPVDASGYTWINVSLYNDAGTTGWFAEAFLEYF